MTGRAADALREYPRASECEPFRVVMELGAPLVMAHPWMHFDGLLSYLVFRDALGELFWLLPSRQPLPVEIPLPLRETEGIWHGSVSNTSNKGWHTTTAYKKFPTRDIAVLHRGKRKRVNLASGRFRNWMISLPYAPIRVLKFYGCGDIEITSELLRHVKNIGKKTAYGFGAIKKISIEDEDEDKSLVSGKIAMRPLPVRMLSEYEDQTLMATRPPYWSKDSVELCAPPGAVVCMR